MPLVPLATIGPHSLASRPPLKALADRAGRAHTARTAAATALALGGVTVLLGLDGDDNAQLSHAQRLLARLALLRAAAASGCRR